MIELFLQVLWILAFIRRQKTIGGPLLVFIIQVFVKTPLALLDLLGVVLAWRFRDQSARLPFDEWKFYEAFLILAANFGAITLTAIAALALVMTRRWRFVAYVRGGLCAQAVLVVVTLLQHVSLGNWLNAIFPLVFLPYFFLSKRVQHAFHSPDFQVRT
jgi:hypothetical protein